MKRKLACSARLLFLLLIICSSFKSELKAADWYVQTSGNNITGNGTAGNPWQTINHAVLMAAPGDNIYIGSGSFYEQVEIAKDLTLIGQGIDQTKIISPAILTPSFSTVYPTSTVYYAVVYAHDAANINLKSLTVDGNANGDNFPAFLGVGYRNAGGLVDNCKIVSIINNPPYTSEFGYGLFAIADNGVDRNLFITNSSFVIFQKTALGFLGGNLTVNVDASIIEGAGPILTLTQNGIQISHSATGSIKNSKIKNLAYTEGSYSASGILIMDARSPVLISGNEMNDCQTSIYMINTNGTISQNKIIYNTGNMGGLTYWYGILVRNGEATISGNELDGDGHGTGIDGFTFAAGEKTKITVTNNSLKNFETGISTEADADGSCATGFIKYNSILNTYESLYNNQDLQPDPACDTPDAPCNWFGTTSLAEIKEKIVGNFKFDTWLTDGVDLEPGVTGFQLPPGVCEQSTCVDLDAVTGIKETFPNQFNTGFYKSLYNKNFTGSSGTWTVNSDENATMVVTKPYYSPSTSYALKVVHFKTSSCSNNGWSKAVSPKLNLGNACCPNDVKLNFTLWSYNVCSGDIKAKLEIDFSADNGVTWSEVWSRTSAQLYSTYGANGKGLVNIPVPAAYQNSNFRYRIRGEMAQGDYNNFYVFIDDIHFTSPETCTPLGSIGDYVWKDVNENGKQDAGEPGIANVTVKLTLPDATVITKTTDASGAYLFTGLATGNYTVTFTTPTGFEPTVSNTGLDDALDSDPVNGTVAVALAPGQNNKTIDAGFKVKTCTNTTNHTETFPNKFNTYITTSLCNKTFTGSSGTWTVNSNSRGAMAVTTPAYSPSSSYALKVVNFNTNGCGSGWTSAVSPKVNLSNPCCPSEVKMSFTLWTYKVAAYDSKAKLEIDFSKDNGYTWTEVWSKTSAQLHYSYGANGKTTITISVPQMYQNTTFRYRIRGEMASGDGYNFYLFIDDIKVGSPASCTGSSSYVYGARITDTESADKASDVVTGSEVEEEAARGKTAADTFNEERPEFSVNVFPNPSEAEFQLQLSSKQKTPVLVRIMDLMGRIVKQAYVAANQSIRFGKEFKAGSYIVEVIQGERKETLKVIKL